MDFSNMTNLRELFAAGGPVLIVLLLLSVFSLSIILERFFNFRKSIGISRKLINYCRHPLHSDNYEKVKDACTKEMTKNTPAAQVIMALITKLDRSNTELKEIAASTIDWEITKLQRKLTVLGTLGSITPFIGLFGTVIGVMHAFKDLAGATAAAGGASVVAAGIAEALINTAAGLFVAIPAVIAYNYFLSKTEYFGKELENMADEIIFQRRG
ncbi:MAG: MotA/TolQ/ExbB proton channel family protein [Elusimicrobiaceae bacterium]|nr:MotA/TolQ/ExbB proton channel family protein [Elusimicrobiaceae bacterium]